MKRRAKRTSRSIPWHWVVVGAAILFIGIGVGVIWQPFTAEETGTPRLALEQTVVDEGYLQYDTPVRSAFRLENVGDGTLRILDQPEVELVEGC